MADTPPVPPVAKRVPVPRELHGATVVDDYAWLRDRDDPDTRAYLEAENAYTKAMMAGTEALQERLFEEIRSRVQETDMSVPARKGDWWYATRTEEGRQYAIHVRWGADVEPQEQVLLDQNVLGEGQDYFALGAFSVSHDHNLLAYSTDTSGAEVYTLRVRDLRTGEDLPDTVERTYYGTTWGNDGRSVFYTRPDAAMRPHQVWRHTLGTPADDDVLVYQEDDERFFVGVGKTRTQRYIVISAGSKITTELRVLDADDPTAEPRLVAARRQGIEYSLDHGVHPERGERFFIVTNDGAENFRLVEAPVDDPRPERWTDVVDHDPTVKLEAVDAFARHLVLYERAGAVERIRVLRLADGDLHVVEQPEPVYSAWAGVNLEFETTLLRYNYTSLVTPTSVYDYELDQRTRDLKKRQPVLGGFDPDDYETARTWATAADGARIPVSVVHRRGVPRDGSAPCLLYGYGAYELSIDPTFSSARLSLLNRGMVFAIAHVRGGGEMGRAWYEHGKLQEKANTFTDFIACAEHLVAEGWASPARLAARGGSAGGLLMGAVTNLRPDLFAAVVAEVPFVDVLNTMLDASLPLTVTEWEEWGDPRQADFGVVIGGYAPYENVRPARYPAMLVTAGLNDPRVSYWEPAKWVAKQRATATGGGPILLKTEMGAGHSGPSGRYDAWRDEAFVYAFLLATLAVEGGPLPGAS